MIPAVILPTPQQGHWPDRLLTFATSAGDLDVTVCTCGRMFDEVRFAVHVEREAGRG